MNTITTRSALVIATIAIASAGRVNADFTFGTPVNLGPNVNSSVNEACPFLSADGLTLYFYSGSTSGADGDIWVCTKPSLRPT